MKDKLEAMAIANGTCTYEGKRYILTQQAYQDVPEDEAPMYRASAICESDEPDAEGWQTAYEVEWDLREDYDPAQTDDESCACDWEHADRVRVIGEYNAEMDPFF